MTADARITNARTATSLFNIGLALQAVMIHTADDRIKCLLEQAIDDLDASSRR